MKNGKALKTIIFIVVLLIPIIYSFFYLKSYWNPYGDLTGLKIAVVNLDEGDDGKNQGNEFVTSLENDGTFTISPVSLDVANEGMQNGDYYAMITIPSNFTKCLNSASSKDKQISTITYSPNQASNYLSSQIINSAVKSMEINLQGKISSSIVETLSDNLKEVPNSLEKMADASNQLESGAKSLNSGLNELNNGMNKLNSSYTDFDDGLTSAYNGSKSLDNGISEVNSGVSSLSDGANSLDTALSQINSGVDDLSSKGAVGISDLATGIVKLNTGAESLNTGIDTYVDGTNNLLSQFEALTPLLKQAALLNNSSDPQAQALAKQAQVALQALNAKQGQLQTLKNSGSVLKSGAKQLSVGSSQLASATKTLPQITNGITNLKTALSKVKAGTTTLNSGVNTLNIGAKKLKAGSTSLSSGLSTLSNSSTQIKSALNTLNDGTNSAYNGSTQLLNGTHEFSNQIADGLNDANSQLESLNGLEDFAEDPVEFKTEPYGEVDSYGLSFTPLFLCIGLWVGALMCYVVLYYDQKHRFGVLDHDSKNKFLQNILYIGIGALQGIIVGGLLEVCLGFEVQNAALYFFASILIGITFTSIIQFLIRNFGDVGKFLALIILVLQLAASGGTFPIETIDKGFRAISPFLPMTYSINLLREILVPTATNFSGKYIVILVSITTVTLAITYIVDFVRNKKNNS